MNLRDVFTEFEQEGFRHRLRFRILKSGDRASGRLIHYYERIGQFLRQDVECLDRNCGKFDFRELRYSAIFDRKLNR